MAKGFANHSRPTADQGLKTENAEKFKLFSSFRAAPVLNRINDPAERSIQYTGAPGRLRRE
jgi:hypothetical protein